MVDNDERTPVRYSWRLEYLIVDLLLRGCTTGMVQMVTGADRQLIDKCWAIHCFHLECKAEDLLEEAREQVTTREHEVHIEQRRALNDDNDDNH